MHESLRCNFGYAFLFLSSSWYKVFLTCTISSMRFYLTSAIEWSCASTFHRMSFWKVDLCFNTFVVYLIYLSMSFIVRFLSAECFIDVSGLSMSTEDRKVMIVNTKLICFMYSILGSFWGIFKVDKWIFQILLKCGRF